MLYKFFLPMVLCVVSFILYFGLVACESCFKHDALVRVSLCYFVWCVDNVSSRY